MSYSDILSQYSQRMADTRAHEDMMTSQNIDKKAGMIEDAFKKITEPIAQAGQVVDAASGALLVGRKLYTKLGKKIAGKAVKGKPANQPSEGEGGESEPTTDGNPAPAQASADTGAEAGEAGQATEGSGGLADLGYTESDADALLGGQDGSAAVDAGAQDAARGATRSAANAADGGPSAGESITQGEGVGDVGQTQLAQSAAGEEGSEFLQQPRSVSQTLVQRAPAQASADSAGGADASAGATTTSEGVASSGAAATDAAGATANTAGEIASGAGRAVGNIATKAVTKVASSAAETALPEAATDAGIGVAGQALDWLGPIGLGVGAITGLVDLFENIFGGKKATEQAENVKGQLQGEGGGVDVGSMEQKQAPTTLV